MGVGERRKPDYVVLPRQDGQWLLTREEESPAESEDFASKQEALDAGRQRARADNVRLGIKDVSGDTHKHQREQQPGEGMPDWVEPDETL